MRIKEFTSEMGNDFSAVMECEHCRATQQLSSGYHDNYYHTQVIPAMACNSCGKNRAGIISAAVTERTMLDLLVAPYVVTTPANEK